MAAVRGSAPAPNSAPTPSYSTAAPAVEFRGVVKRYGNNVALDGLDISLARGETVALLGPNGAGKSTAIGLVLGLLRPDSGDVRVLGGRPESARRAGRIAAMLQSAGLPAGARVGEILDFVRALYPAPLPLPELLTRAGLTGLRDRGVDRLSGGEAQRVRFAMAIAGNPEIVFLDEPTVAMDVESRRAFWDQMREFAGEGRTVLFATHYLDEADEVADRIVVLNRGRVVASGPATEIKARAATRNVRFTLAGADPAALLRLPGVVDVAVRGLDVTLRSSDADNTVAALYAARVPLRDLAVNGADLEEAFLALTEAPAA
jgi:ABC-2 type transport system ATP-binding protein